MIAIDTNVLVYAIDADDPLKQAKARALLRRLTQPPVETVLLWQVAAEFVACLRRWQTKRQFSDATVEFHLREILNVLRLELPASDVLERALDLPSRYSLSHWDSMLLAACIVAGVDTLYSEDLTDGATYDTVNVVNPFV